MKEERKKEIRTFTNSSSFYVKRDPKVVKMMVELLDEVDRLEEVHASFKEHATSIIQDHVCNVMKTCEPCIHNGDCPIQVKFRGFTIPMTIEVLDEKAFKEFIGDREPYFIDMSDAKTLKIRPMDVQVSDKAPDGTAHLIDTQTGKLDGALTNIDTKGSVEGECPRKDGDTSLYDATLCETCKITPCPYGHVDPDQDDDTYHADMVDERRGDMPPGGKDNG